MICAACGYYTITFIIFTANEYNENDWSYRMSGEIFHCSFKQYSLNLFCVGIVRQRITENLFTSQVKNLLIQKVKSKLTPLLKELFRTFMCQHGINKILESNYSFLASKWPLWN